MSKVEQPMCEMEITIQIAATELESIIKQLSDKITAGQLNMLAIETRDSDTEATVADMLTKIVRSIESLQQRPSREQTGLGMQLQ